MPDTELVNYRTGIDVTWGVGDGSDKGTAYMEEYPYHDKTVFSQRWVYIRDDTLIAFSHNARNKADYPNPNSDTIGVNGKDGVPNSGDEGQIRYKIDRERQFLRWSRNAAGTSLANIPAYNAPFTLASQTYEVGVPVVGTTGGNGQPVSSKTLFYMRGKVDAFGDEWHTLGYADDDYPIFSAWNAVPNAVFVDQKFWASDGNEICLVVNPKTPGMTVRATGTGQFYTTPPKAYWQSKITTQRTYMAPGSSGTVTMELRDIYGRNIFYRINGGAWVTVGANNTTISDSAFSNGENLLEYYSAGFAANVKQRYVVKNPAHPSLSESHGYALFGTAENLAAAKARVTRDPYVTMYTNMRTRTDFSSYNGMEDWNAKRGTGLRALSGPSLTHTFIALDRGWDHTQTGQSRSHGRVAKEMLLENTRSTSPIGFEIQMSSDASPTRELHAFGYYDIRPDIERALSYDIFCANFRDDQVTGGMTAIENYWIRDSLASVAYEAMQWAAGMQGLGEPGMWGGARMMGATIIAIVMPEYSTPYYGTSGFGVIQDVFPDCPFQADMLTWKQALYDVPGPTRTAFPNYTWGNGMSNAGTASLFTAAGQFNSAGVTLKDGDWLVKGAYYSDGQMGGVMTRYANVLAQKGYALDSRLVKSFQYATAGTMLSAYDGSSVGRQPLWLLINDTFPDRKADNSAWVKSLPSNDPNSDNSGIANNGVYAFAWYDDASNLAVPPSITTQPQTQTVVVGANVSFSVVAAGTTPFSYQWYKDGGSISGATASSLALTNVQLSDAGAYYCVVTNEAGYLASNSATLTVNAAAVAPTITTHPQSATLTAGQSASLSVVATGTAPLSYQWRKNGTPISGATSSSYSISITVTGDSGSYTCVVTNAAGSATSNAATLTVNPYVPPTGGSPVYRKKKRKGRL